MGRGARGRGRSLVPPSVAAAQATRQYSQIPTVAASQADSRPPFPSVPPHLADRLFNCNSELQDVIDCAAHVRSLLKATPFYLEDSRDTTNNGDGLERYSDRYNVKTKRDKLSSIQSPHSLFPDELQSIVNAVSTVKATHTAASFSYAAVVARLQEAEKADDHTAEEDETERTQEHKGGAEEEEEEEEEVYEEEDLEDETDYNLSYFDNGEDYEDRGDGDYDEPSY